MASVATTGAYSDLSGTPAIPDALTDLDTSVTGAQLDADHTKLAGIASGAEANVQPDWDASSGDAAILNKPALGSAASHAATDFATASQGATADSAVQPGDLAAVATSGSYNDLVDTPADTGAVWGDITGTLANQTDLKTALDAKVDASSLGTAATHAATDFATSAQGALADSSVQPGDLATVATSGAYTDLSGTPTIPGALTDLDTTVTGAQLNADHSKLAGIASGAEVNVQPDWNAASGDAQILNKPTLGTASSHAATDFATATQGDKADTAIQAADLATVATTGAYSDLSGVPDIPAALTDLDTTVSGAQLNALKTKVDGIAAGAEANVQADWDATTGDAAILNKPTLGSAASHNVGEFATATQGALADSAVQPADLADVATSGAYGDLSGTPTLGTAAATNSTAYATAAQGALADSAVQPGDLSTVATSGDYADLLNTPALPTALTDLDTTVTGTQLNALYSWQQSITATASEINALHGAGVTKTELGYLDATSSIQTQLDGKQAALGYTPEDAANKGAAGGYASLDSGGKVPASQLPATVMEYQGVWNASTNTPTLADGIGNIGDVYRVSVAGTQDLGSGDIEFGVGDWVTYSGSVWEVSGGSDAVSSVAGRTGDVVLTKSDVGLGNVDNTADASKSVASAAKLTTARAINGVNFDGTANITVADATKEPKIGAGTTAQYWRGDKTWQALNAAAIDGLGSAATTSATAYATAAQGTKADSAVQPADLATVATSGAYGDLSGTPAIPDALTDLDTTVTGAQLNADHAKLAGIASGAEANVQSDWNASSGDAAILNKPTLGTAAATDSSAYATAAQGSLAASAVQPGDLATVATSGAYSDLSGTPNVPTALTDLDTTVTGAQLNADHSKLAGIASGAEANVQSDWNASSGDAAILNKPTVPTALSQLSGTLAVNHGGTGTTSLSGIVKGNGTSGFSVASASDFPTLNQDTTGNAATATELSTARTLSVNLGSGASPTFDGSANVTLGVSGVLPLTKGGTGGTSASSARSSLGLGTAATTDSTAYATAAQGTKADGAVQGSGTATGLWMGSSLPASGTTGVLYVVT
ncbi:beta strand repeat-containing protein [Mycolicibacter kumamotonensis]|uniref:beta strand repeat-containing protein n=1 Tax=Mycolicibacter kumamotonensis TaxID=354243 RepID=UPI0010426F1E|nr:hypothetical protein [Mycolicibacter kumamotonensis]